jgi:G:T/U-mismatch repair DNA glycosylase
LIEWDVDIPTLDVLQGEARKAQQRMDALIEQPESSGNFAEAAYE